MFEHSKFRSLVGVSTLYSRLSKPPFQRQLKTSFKPTIHPICNGGVVINPSIMRLISFGISMKAMCLSRFIISFGQIWTDALPPSFFFNAERYHKNPAPAINHHTEALRALISPYGRVPRVAFDFGGFVVSTCSSKIVYS